MEGLNILTMNEYTYPWIDKYRMSIDWLNLLQVHPVQYLVIEVCATQPLNHLRICLQSLPCDGPKGSSMSSRRKSDAKVIADDILSLASRNAQRHAFFYTFVVVVMMTFFHFSYCLF